MCPWHKGEPSPDASTIGVIRKAYASYQIKIYAALDLTQKALHSIRAQRCNTYRIIN
ncbi:hypothetical protein GCM10007094_11830 [Pseudovibrio japonicus]|uniref:Uncharacterized protein n=1 Tax=Pseudovibrio japonicus TaxID=366534 RepID=A0ABQ3E7X2_9HYPH|nr:hypothetical protein GCM10007094_11830 [Pseudovibrio japonicus]